ncbi:hypothetical protein MASR1M59_22810 [Melaminivora sp.]
MSTPIGSGGRPIMAPFDGGTGQPQEALTAESQGGGPLARLRPNRPQPASVRDTPASDANTSLEASKRLQTEGSKPSDKLTSPPKMPDDLRFEELQVSRFDDSQVSADIYAFMALFQKMAQEMRNTARTQRTAEFQGQISSLQNAAEKMKEAAGQRFTAAIVQGVTQITSGLAQAGASAYSASKTIQGARMEARGSNMVAKAQAGAESNPASNVLRATQRGNNMIADGKALGATGTKWAGYSQASGGLIGGTGGIIAASFNYKADMLDADKTNLETQAKQHETAVQHANDMMQQMMDVIRDVRDKIAAIQQSQVETTRGIARNI